ncbi:MAG: carboxypeptidase-like regulatory domain-containing protein [Patescibacteria group bacterium]
MKILKRFFLAFFLFFLICYSQKPIQAAQTADVCYSQCLAYRFIWQGTYCYDVFADNCTEENGNTIKKAIKFLKTIYDTVKSGDNIDIPFTAMFICKPLIDSCIVPNQESCRQVCEGNQFAYAPDLSVGHPESSFQGVFFDDKTNQLYFKLVNNGMGYAWNIDVEASSGHTPNRNGIIQNSTQLFKENIEHLIFFGARNGPPKSFSDSVQDFLVEESLNGQYLHNFKSWLVDSLDLHSDSKDYNVPSYWIKAVPFTPRPGELNRITYKVDPNQLIPEVWEENNTFVLDIDLRPTPARYDIETFSQHIIDGTLNSFLVDFLVKNTGEESGRANVKIYDGKFQEGKNPIYQTEESIEGKGDKNFETTINLDLSSDSNPYCGKYKQYTIVVIDEEGNKTERGFSLPIYLGSVNGRVEDLFGKPVVGATIRSSSGEETQSDKNGRYHLKGITTLGTIIITVTHPEFSKSTSQEIEFKYQNEFDACKEGNLIFNSVNLILKDQDVLFTVYIKDISGNPVKANVIVVNSDWRFNEMIDGSGPLPGMQPGKYIFTISAPGYKTISQDINAVPNNQHLEFTLEKLLGRPDDASFRLIAPRLLWKKTLGLGEKIVSNISDSKNGNLLVAYAVDNKAKNSNLFFLDLITGKLIKETSAPYALGYEGKVGLDASYDGQTVGLYTDLGIKKDNESIMKIFNSSGNEYGSITLSKGQGGRATMMDVSPDGFYLCPGGLFNKGLHKYTRYETEGKMDYKKGSREQASCGYHFLRNNNIIVSCEGKQEGYCEETLANQQVRVIGDVDEGINTYTILDSAFDSITTVVRTYKKLYYLGSSSWKKELKSDNMYKDVAVSPGGMYTIVTEGSGADLKLKIFGNTGGDKTPDFPYKNVKFVFANDKGLFFAQVVLNKIEFYQVGEYQTEYKPELQASPTPEISSSGLYHFANGGFDPAGNMKFEDLITGDIYMAGRNINFDMGSGNGTLHILNGTYFSVDQSHHPIILRGQLTADFNSPTTVYAIKFDRFLMDLFKTKLGQFIAGTLPAEEYFTVQNIHTKFTVKNNEGKLNVMVDSGEVKVLGKKINLDIKQGRQIIINKNNEIKETGYVNYKTLSIIFGIIILIISAIIFRFRKTTSILWKGIKSFFRLLMNIFNKYAKRK